MNVPNFVKLASVLVLLPFLAGNLATDDAKAAGPKPGLLPNSGASISQGIQDAVAIFEYYFGNPPSPSCCSFPGDVDHSGGAVPVDVLDILYLVAYLFQGGATPYCMDAADASGGCEGPGPDVVDLLAIVGFLFQGAGDLPECHSCGWL